MTYIFRGTIINIHSPGPLIALWLRGAGRGRDKYIYVLNVSE